jgi:hypothetical protein
MAGNEPGSRKKTEKRVQFNKDNASHFYQGWVAAGCISARIALSNDYDSNPSLIRKDNYWFGNDPYGHYLGEKEKLRTYLFKDMIRYSLQRDDD